MMTDLDDIPTLYDRACDLCERRATVIDTEHGEAYCSACWLWALWLEAGDE